MSREISLDPQTFLLVLTGAGISAESGIPTFRDAGGLWEQHSLEEVATPQGFAADPERVWRFYSARRAAAAGCQPNPGHLALAEAERRLGDRFLLVTQNIDALHGAAGSERLIELHGNLFLSRCSVCDRPPFEDREGRGGDRPFACEICRDAGRAGLLRPHVVWFGELLDMDHFVRIDRFLRASRGRRLVFLAAGTSGTVYPAAALVDEARAAGGETWLVNADPAENLSRFHHFVRGRSGEVLPALLGHHG